LEEPLIRMNHETTILYENGTGDCEEERDQLLLFIECKRYRIKVVDKN